VCSSDLDSSAPIGFWEKDKPSETIWGPPIKKLSASEESTLRDALKLSVGEPQKVKNVEDDENENEAWLIGVCLEGNSGGIPAIFEIEYAVPQEGIAVKGDPNYSFFATITLQNIDQRIEAKILFENGGFMTLIGVVSGVQDVHV